MLIVCLWCLRHLRLGLSRNVVKVQKGCAFSWGNDNKPWEIWDTLFSDTSMWVVSRVRRNICPTSIVQESRSTFVPMFFGFVRTCCAWKQSKNQRTHGPMGRPLGPQPRHSWVSDQTHFFLLARMSNKYQQHVPSANWAKLLKRATYSGFTHWKWWYSIVVLVYQRVSSMDD